VKAASRAERDIVVLVAIHAGLRRDVIARVVGVSTSTVRRTVVRYQKLREKEMHAARIFQPPTRPHLRVRWGRKSAHLPEP